MDFEQIWVVENKVKKAKKSRGLSGLPMIYDPVKVRKAAYEHYIEIITSYFAHD